MREIAINELTAGEVDTIEEYLKSKTTPGAVEGMFWILLPDDCLAEAQQGHEECGPFVFAVELGRNAVIFELLVRSRSNLHCSCTSYATTRQRQYLLDFFDTMIVETLIKA